MKGGEYANFIYVYMKKCNHEFELKNTQYQYPSGMAGTTMAIEYAYFMCKKCWVVIKEEVQSRKD